MNRSRCYPTASSAAGARPRPSVSTSCTRGRSASSTASCRRSTTTIWSRMATIELESQGGWLGITDKYWLVALAPTRASDSRRPSATSDRRSGSLPGRLSAAAGDGGARPGHRKRERVFAGAKEVKLLERYRDELRHPAVRPGGRFRLVLLPHQADLLRAALLLPRGRQFRRGDPAADGGGQAAVLSARQQIVPGDEQDEEAPARR